MTSRMGSLLGGVSGVAVAVMALTGAGPVAAQDSVEELVVTARRVEENVQTVPITISAITAQEIARTGTNSLEDLASLTPSLSFYEVGSGTVQTPMIRGVSQLYKFSSEGTVAIFLDGLYLANRDALNVQMLDFQRIEVLKGPQSTAYGREAFSGAINYVTADPGSAWEGYLEGSAGTDSWSDLRAVVSGPVVPDLLGVRLAVSKNSFDGTFKNLGDPGDKLAGNDSTAIAGTLKYTPTQNLTVTGKGYYTESDLENGALFYDVNNCGRGPTGGFGAHCGSVNVQDAVDISPAAYGSRSKSYLFGLKYDYDIGRFSVSGQTGYSRSESSALPDNDLTSRGIPVTARNTVTGATRTVYANQYFATGSGDGIAKSFSQEFRARYDGPRLSLLAGVFYLKIERDRTSTFGSDTSMLLPNEIIPFNQWTLFGTPDPINNPIANNHVLSEETELSFFAGAQYRLTDKLRLNVEARHRDQTLDNTALRASAAPLNPPRVQSATFKNMTPRFSVDYEATPDVFLFASAAKGIRSGGFNNVFSPNAPQDATYDAESNWSYELGAKTQWLERRLTLNGALFYSELSDLQITSPSSDPTFTIPGSLVTKNIGTGRVKGFELEMRAVVNRNLSVGGGYSYSDSAFGDGTLDRAARNCGSDRTICRFTPEGIVDVSGNRLPITPSQTFNGDVTVSGDFTDDLAWYARADVSYQDEAFADPDNITSFGERWLVNARFGVEWGDLEFAVWGKNLFDERYANSVFTENDCCGGARRPKVQLARGRVIGVTARSTFGAP